MDYPITVQCSPVQAISSAEVRTTIAPRAATGTLQIVPTLSRTIIASPGTAMDSSALAAVHSALDSAVQITSYMFNRSAGTAFRDFYHINNGTITAHTCGAEKPTVFPMNCSSLTSTTVTLTRQWGDSASSDGKYILVTDNQNFSSRFMLDPTVASTITLTVLTTMNNTTLSSAGTTVLPAMSVTDKFTCSFTNPLQVTYPTTINLGDIKYGDTVSQDFQLTYSGYTAILPNTVLTVTPARAGESTVTLGSYDISLRRTDGSEYKYGDPITPTVSTTLKIVASLKKGAPVITGFQTAGITLTHSFI